MDLTGGVPDKDPRVDAYIAKSAAFAQPILNHLRELVHRACPEVEETIKWSFPNFMYRGMLCSMAAFTHHCSFGFWKASQVLGEGGESPGDKGAGMGQFGRITARSELPSDRTLISYIKKAAQLNEAGIKKTMPTKPKSSQELVVPDDLTAAIQKHHRAQATWDGLSYSHRKEYVEWLTEAKRQETRQRRLETTLKWLADGKPRNWKYMNCAVGKG